MNSPRLFQSGLVATILACASCAPPLVALDRIQRIEVSSVGGEPRRGPILEGKELREALSTAKCHESRSLWKGGVPVRLVLEDGSVVETPGLSYYGGFLRISMYQWCELDQRAWDLLFPTDRRR